jgi:hypothetical protein
MRRLSGPPFASWRAAETRTTKLTGSEIDDGSKRNGDTAVLEAAVGHAPLLHKPSRPAELAAAVRTALDSDQNAKARTV